MTDNSRKIEYDPQTYYDLRCKLGYVWYKILNKDFMLEESTQTVQAEIRVENPTSGRIIAEFEKWRRFYKDAKSTDPSLNALKQIFLPGSLKEFGNITREVRQEVVGYLADTVPDDLGAWVIEQRDFIIREDHSSVLRFYLDAAKALGIPSRKNSGRVG